MNPSGLPVYPGGLPVAFPGTADQAAAAQAAAFQGQYPAMYQAAAMNPAALAAQQQAVHAQQQAQQQQQQPAGSAQKVKFESALDFLDKVKTVFGDQPGVYNQFLDIMKGFKTQTIDTPGVIQRVKTLFKGHPELISGFNNFLPPGYKIEPDEHDEDATPEKQRQREIEANKYARFGKYTASAAEAKAAVMQQPQVFNTLPVQPDPNAVAAAAGAAGEDPSRKQPELDHARTYVKKIKLRFGSQPHIYKQFLEILHTFHREQHTIQDVYQQVAKLFKDHADLLSEFAQFLPDPSIHGPGGNPMLQAQHQQAQHHKDDDMMSTRSVQTRGRGTARPAIETSTQGRAQTARQAAAAAAAAAASSGPITSMSSRARGMPVDERKDGSYGTFEELGYFFRIKMALTGSTSANATSQAYDEFLKVLSLFNQEIITRQEVYQLVKELLKSSTDGELTVWFRNFLGVEDEDGDEPMGMSEVDWTQTRKLGPSYRETPERLRLQANCTGRQDNPICNEVLNDQWVSVPTGSEDGTGFKSSRKTQFEELLFKCEDDRFELDLIIENNLSAIRTLEQLAEQFKGVKATDELKLRDEDLDALTTRAIRRIYNDRADDILRLLFSRPAGTLPVVINRLKQKHIEWSQARREWNKIWRQVFKKNYAKGQDYQSVNFKAEEKKNLSAKGLLAELKRRAAHVPTLNSAGALLDSENIPVHFEVSYASADFVKHHDAMHALAIQLVPAVSQPVDPTSLVDHFSPTDYSLMTTNGITPAMTPEQIELGSKAFNNVPLWGDARRLVSCLIDNLYPKIDKTKFDSFFDDCLGTLFKFVTSPSSSSAEGVKPISTQMDVTSIPSQTKSVLLGNDTLFLICKYLSVLLSRLAQGREFSARRPPLKHKTAPKVASQQQFDAMKAAEQKKDGDAMEVTTEPAAASTAAEPKKDGDAMEVDQEGATKEAGEGDAVTGLAVAPASSQPITVDSVKNRYEAFLTAVQNLMSNAIDQQALEDEIRDAFGVDSFPLFTTERVVQLIGKHIVAMLNDDAQMQFVSVYTYELSRGAAAFSDGAYINNVRQLLGAEKRAYRLLYNAEKQLLGVTEVSLTTGSAGAGDAGSSAGNVGSAAGGSSGSGEDGASGDKSSGPSGSSSGGPNLQGGSGNSNQPMPKDASDRMLQFVDTSVVDMSNVKSVPFLRRTIQQSADQQDVFVSNELAVFVDPAAARLRFLQDSEDVFVRRTRSGGASRVTRSSSRLANFAASFSEITAGAE